MQYYTPYTIQFALFQNEQIIIYNLPVFQSVLAKQHNFEHSFVFQRVVQETVICFRLHHKVVWGNHLLEQDVSDFLAMVWGLSLNYEEKINRIYLREDNGLFHQGNKCLQTQTFSKEIFITLIM